MEMRCLVDDFANEVAERIRKEHEIKAQITDVEKNGVILKGIVIGDNMIKPTIYLNHFYEDGKSYEETVNEVLRLYNKEKIDDNVGQEFLNLFNDVDWVLEHIYIACSKANTYEDYVTKKLNNMTLSLYIRLDMGDNNGTVRIKEEHIKKWDIDEDVLWAKAQENCGNEVEVKGLLETLKEIHGVTGGTFSIEDTMLVVSNKRKQYGAYSVFTETAQEEIKKRMRIDKVVVIPSSVHEVIVVPYDENTNLKEFENMIRDVNSTQVDETEQLGDKPILLAI